MQEPAPINRANLLGILGLGLALLAFAAWPLVPSQHSQRPVSTTGGPTFLEEWWNVGQGKGFRWWGEGPQAIWTLRPALTPETRALSVLIGERTQYWTPDELSDLSHFILTKSKEYKMSPLFVLSLIEVESGYHPTIVSNRGAVGMLQLLPDTAKEVALNSGMVWTGPHLLENPKTNIDLGLRYMNTLKKQFGNEEHTLTAYNMGPNALRLRLSKRQKVSRVYFERVMDAFSDYQKKTQLPRARKNWSRAWL